MNPLNKSESLKEFAAAFCKFQAEVPPIPKDAVNPFFHSKYSSLENIISTVRPHLAANGLSFTQFPSGKGMITIILHTSGEWVESYAEIPLKEQTPQGYGSGITYLRRYALSAALGIATEDDDDGNAASQKTSMPKVVVPVKPEKTRPLKASELAVYEASLKDSKNLDQLKTAWHVLPPEAKDKFKVLKETLKKQLADEFTLEI